MKTLFREVDAIFLNDYSELGYFITTIPPLNLSIVSPPTVESVNTFTKKYVWDIEMETWGDFGNNNKWYRLYIIPYHKYNEPIVVGSGRIELYEDKPTREQVVNLLQEMR